MHQHVAQSLSRQSLFYLAWRWLSDSGIPISPSLAVSESVVLLRTSMRLQAACTTTRTGLSL